MTDDTTPTTIDHDQPPEWLSDAILQVIGGAFIDLVTDDGSFPREHLFEGLRRFAETIDDHTTPDAAPPEYDVLYGCLALGMARMTVQSDPATWAATDGRWVGVSVENATTGEVVDDPDAVNTDDPDWAGVLAAQRILAATGNGDGAMAMSLFMAVPEDGIMAMLVVLAETCATAVAHGMHAKGMLRPEHLEVWERKITAGTARDVPRRNQARMVPLGAVADDPGEWGTVVTAVGLHLPDGLGAARCVADTLAALAEVATGRGVTLCGVPHWEEIQDWQVPRRMRGDLVRHQRKVRAKHGVPALLVHVTQHTGPCPDRLPGLGPR